MPQFTDMRRPAFWADTRSRLVDSVVVGYDGSEASRRAVERAMAVAEPGGRVVLVTASPPSRELEERIGARRARAADDLLDEAVKLCRGRDVHIATRIAHAEPADALVAAARDSEAALIVIGARGESFIARALRGPIREAVVAQAPCDVLVVR
jgi:nucleotide-binding universal stress UspA family protein